MSADESPERTVFDTVVINYFLAVGQIDTLIGLCGDLLVPRAVFDPDESDDLREEAMSELRRGWHLHRRRAKGSDIAPHLKARAHSALPHFERLPDLVGQGKLVAVDLSDVDLALYAELRDATRARGFGLTVGLGHGEAAVLALCKSGEYRPATDDTDAIKVAEKLLPGVVPLRIRSLFRLAVQNGLLNADEAIAAHKAMKLFGFWDTEDLSF
jgi:predicted nucleic acid-binding protein